MYVCTCVAHVLSCILYMHTRIHIWCVFFLLTVSLLWLFSHLLFHLYIHIAGSLTLNFFRRHNISGKHKQDIFSTVVWGQVLFLFRQASRPVLSFSSILPWIWCMQVMILMELHVSFGFWEVVLCRVSLYPPWCLCSELRTECKGGAAGWITWPIWCTWYIVHMRFEDGSLNLRTGWDNSDKLRH